MLFVRDKGRMCNNILQFAHVYAWAREHGRRAVSMRFAYKYQYFHICHTRWHHFAVYLLAKWAARCGLLPVASFHQPGSNPKAEALLERCKWLMVEGWEVRYYDLFLKYKDEILRLFAFDAKLRAKVLAYMRSAEGGETEGVIRLGVHVRRGDYQRWQGGKYLFADDTFIAYIKAFAAQHIGKKVHVYICGNDPTLNRARYETELQGMAISFPNGNPGEDLCLLSLCHWLIGPPSTFSLVAAMYNDLPLCWMMQPNVDESSLSFQRFNYLFRHIL